MFTPDVVLLHNNMRSHTNAAACPLALLDPFSWELFDRIPYSSDLTPSDYHLFFYLKNWLGSQCFNNNELMDGVKKRLSSQVVDFFDTGIKTYSPIQVLQFRR
jgi:hypothetical protein